MGGVGCCGCCIFDVWLLGSMILVSYCTTFPFLSKKTVMYLESPNRLLYLAYSHLSPYMSKLVSLGSPAMSAITSFFFHKRYSFYKLLYCFMVAKVQLSFQIKREGFPKVEGKIPISDFGYLFHFSGMAVMIRRDYYLLLNPNMTE